MTKREYREYRKTVEKFFEDNALRNLSRKHNSETEESAEEYFSWQSCDCCGTSMGGSRIDADGYSEKYGVLEFSICTDCEYFAEYGQLDDMTMMEISA